MLNFLIRQPYGPAGAVVTGGTGISESLGRRAETHGFKSQDYGVFAHRNPLLWLG